MRGAVWLEKVNPSRKHDAIELQPIAHDVDDENNAHAMLPERCLLHDRQRLATTAVIALASIAEKLDEQLLPSVYPFVARSLNASPAALGYLTLSRALVQSVASPLGGLLGAPVAATHATSRSIINHTGHTHNRVRVVCAGCALWTTMTALFAGATHVWHGCALWAVNGIGLALVVPNCQSIVADDWPAAQRGRAFGALQCTMNLGGMAGALWGTNVGAATIAGVAGWRWAFAGVALGSGVSGVLTWALARDPRPVNAARGLGADHVAAWTAIRHILVLPTFIIVILQGIAGTFPWLALAWATTYLQLIGLSPWHTSICYAVFLGAGAPGSMLGGWLGDWAATRAPRWGRVAVAQCSVGAGVPLTLVALKALPREGGSWSAAAYAAVLGVMGLTMTCEVVPEAHRSLIYAFDRSFEGALAALASPLVGMLAQRLGFEGVADIGSDRAANLVKADALANSLLLCTCVPWSLCAVLYSGLYWTYARDRAAVLTSTVRDHEHVELLPDNQF